MIVFRTITIAVLLFGWLCGCAPPPVSVQLPAPVVQDDPGQLVVAADATLEVAPDLLRLRLGVMTEAAEAASAVAENNQRMETLMTRLGEIGITADQLETGQFYIRPQWSVPPRPTPANWERKIIAYQVSNELRVATGKVDLAGEILQLAQQAGANQVGGLTFELADPEHYRLQALAKATRKAMTKAQTLARAAGVSLGRILSISQDSAAVAPRTALAMARAGSAEAQTVPIAAGKVEVEAGVRIVYLLAD